MVLNDLNGVTLGLIKIKLSELKIVRENWTKKRRVDIDNDINDGQNGNLRGELNSLHI